ncbi:hypothetical protein TS85_11500 [Sphingomonas hengshuiensis]|uniref:Uncharacterized protein n=2 Tax=Sphingomonas hengshuiensis TaxID=1609977 RepID=A0A7U5BFS5_9SPHN|nr:hypothetical protein TS85_11500 [Sphingomonas hengshuiensis]
MLAGKRDRPIIFSAAMVRALLDGRKTQTRRLVHPVLKEGVNPHFSGLRAHRHAGLDWMIHGSEEASAPFRVPYSSDDRLYVREHWKTSIGNNGVAPRDLDQNTPVLYLADSSEHGRCPVGVPGKHRQGMHMPRWASRLTLIVEDVRVERLQSIREADAIAEGLAPALEGYALTRAGECWGPTAAKAYRLLWNSLHGEDAWDANPWVVALTFRVVTGNIDGLPA